MAITRTIIDAVITTRCGGKMAAAGLIASSLDDPIAWALDRMGYPVTDPTAVTDRDLCNVPAGECRMLFDLTELRTLKNVVGNLSAVNVSIGPRSEQLNQLSEQIEKIIVRLEAFIAKEYGIGVGSLEGGSLLLDFQERPNG